LAVWTNGHPFYFDRRLGTSTSSTGATIHDVCVIRLRRTPTETIDATLRYIKRALACLKWIVALVFLLYVLRGFLKLKTPEVKIKIAFVFKS